MEEVWNNSVASYSWLPNQTMQTDEKVLRVKGDHSTTVTGLQRPCVN